MPSIWEALARLLVIFCTKYSLALDGLSLVRDLTSINHSLRVSRSLGLLFYRQQIFDIFNNNIYSLTKRNSHFKIISDREFTQKIRYVF